MPKFSKLSLRRLETCHPDLQKVCREVIKVYDFSVICGHRTREEQNEVYTSGKSKLNWPDSKHNKTPSLAVDIAPYPVDWNDKGRFIKLSAHMINAANRLGIKIRWGGDWNGNGKNDERFIDLPHYELV